MNKRRNSMLLALGINDSNVRLSRTSWQEDGCEQEFAKRPNMIRDPQRHRRRLGLELFLP